MSYIIKILIVILVVVAVCFFLKSRDVSNVKSSVDNRNYVVLQKDDQKKAADILATLRRKLITLMEHLESTQPENQDLKKIRQNFCTECISEGDTDSQYTSYTVEKGEKMVFCLRDKATQELHELNLLTYVAIHEFAHVYTLYEVGHGHQFKRNFDFLLKEAQKIGIYQPIDFSTSELTYCGVPL